MKNNVMHFVVVNNECPLKVSVTVRGVGMFMRLFEKSYKV